MSTEMNLQVIMKTCNAFIYGATIGFSERTVLIEFSVRVRELILNTGRDFSKGDHIFLFVLYRVVLSVIIKDQYHISSTQLIIIIIIKIIIIRYGCLLSQAFLPGTSLEPAVIPTAQASSFTLQYFPYYV